LTILALTLELAERVFPFPLEVERLRFLEGEAAAFRETRRLARATVRPKALRIMFWTAGVC